MVGGGEAQLPPAIELMFPLLSMELGFFQQAAKGERFQVRLPKNTFEIMTYSEQLLHEYSSITHCSPLNGKEPNFLTIFYSIPISKMNKLRHKEATSSNQLESSRTDAFWLLVHQPSHYMSMLLYLIWSCVDIKCIIQGKTEELVPRWKTI